MLLVRIQHRVIYNCYIIIIYIIYIIINYIEIFGISSLILKMIGDLEIDDHYSINKNNKNTNYNNHYNVFYLVYFKV